MKMAAERQFGRHRASSSEKTILAPRYSVYRR
jgi:hypothetical protein